MLRRMKLWALGAAILGLMVVGLLYLGIPGGESACQMVDGKWGSAKHICVTRLCYFVGDCGDWAHPLSRCSYLKPGASIAEVYFQLGNGQKIADDRYAWSRGKGDTGEITAVIRDSRLVSLDCS